MTEPAHTRDLAPRSLDQPVGTGQATGRTPNEADSTGH
jgi:hypothetical protein